MKTFMITAAFLAMTAGVAVAGDWDATEVSTKLSSGKLDFTVSSVDGELSKLETGALFTETTVGKFNVYTYGSVAYDLVSDELAVAGTVGGNTNLNPMWSLYGEAKVAYVAPTTSLSDGDVELTPSIGTAYALGESASVFAETGYTWVASNSWASQGGYLEVGGTYAVNETLSVTPSLVRTFDTAADATNLKLEVALAF